MNSVPSVHRAARRVRELALPLALLLPAAAPVTAQIVAYHDQTSVQHQAQFNLLEPQGYRMIALTVYGTTGAPQYAAVWVKRAGPSFVAFHDKTAAEYQSLLDTWGPQGYTPRLLTAMGTFANPRIAGVLEHTGAKPYARHGLGQSEFWDEDKLAREAGYRIAAADVYGADDDPRFIVAWEKKVPNVGEGRVVSIGNGSYQTHFDAMVDGWARPVLVGFNGQPRFLSVWRDDSVGDWIAHHDMTSAQYQAQANLYWNQGYYPIALTANGNGAGARFAAVWAKTDVPLARQWTVTGTAVPELATCDAWVKGWMQQENGRAAALAVVKDGRLVLARGYTLAEPGYPITQPTSLFRIASCNKPLTSIAVHRHYEKLPASIDPTSEMTDFLNPSNVLDDWNKVITIDHLLTHQGGFDRDASFDPMFKDADVATALSKNLPITKRDIFTWMTQTKFLDFYPGAKSKYSNYGYSLLGQVLESLNPGKSYASILRRDVFDPLGLLRPFVGGSLKSQIHADEVRYHPANPYIAESVNSQSRPWVAGQYGGWNQPNMDSHGAYVMAAPDFAKVLAAFDLGGSNPLLKPQSVTDMWTVAPGTSTTLRGWFLSKVDDGKGNKVEMYHHNGKLPGTATLIAHRADGVSFAFFTNADTVVSGDSEGVAISDLLSRVSRWPGHDLFPSVGIPSFGKHFAGAMTPYGTSCGAIGGAAAPRLDGSGTPEIGMQVRFDLTQAPSTAAAAVCLLGVARTSLPLDPLGAFGCRLWTDPVVTLPTPLGRARTASVAVQLQRTPAIVGAHLHGQMALLAPGVNTLGLATTNGLDVLIGGWK